MCIGCICGGVVNESTIKRDIKKTGGWTYLMCFVMPDKQFERYKKYQHAGNKKMASKVFKRWAVSQI